MDVVNLGAHLSSYILNDVGSDYTVLVDGIFGIAYTDSKIVIRLYVLKDDIDYNIDCYIIDNKVEIDDTLGDDFFNLSLKDKFKVVSDVLLYSYYTYDGELPDAYIKLYLTDTIKDDCVEGDYVLLKGKIGVKINKHTYSVYMYHLTIVDAIINVRKVVLKNRGMLSYVLGSDFFDVSDAIKLDIVEDYFNTLS